MEFDILRLTFAFLGGYFLSLAGSLSQLTTNNQLASPSTLGMDGIGVFCVLAATMLASFGVTIFPTELVSFFIFLIISCVSVVIILVRGKKTSVVNGSGSMKRVILLGLTFNLFVGAIFSMVQFAFMALNLDFPSGLWFGSFKFVKANWLYGFLPLLVCSITWVRLLSSDLEKLNLGRGFALGMGVKVERVEKQALFLALILTVVVISFFGVFSFLGLILPHILRSFKLFEKSISKELVFGSVFSGLALCFMDWLCFNFTYQGAELPVGMASGVLGSFFLIFLVSRTKI